MPEFHEIMNIFADAEGSEGAHPPMPSVDTILEPPWLDLGRYHFWEDDHFFKGFDYKNVDRWWRYYDDYGWDYAGYKMQDQLWTGDDSPEAKFQKALKSLTDVAAMASGANASTTYDQSTIWDVSVNAAALDDFLQDYVGDKDAGLLKAYAGIDVPDSAMRGSAAGVFAARIYDLAKRLADLSVQLDRFHNGVNDLRGPLLSKINALVTAVNEAWQSPNATIKQTIDNWYFNLAAGSEEYNADRSQFSVLYHADPPVRGIVGDSITDHNINAELKLRWKNAYDPVFTAANDLYTTMASHYQNVATDLLPIREPVGGLPPGFDPPAASGGGSGGGDEDGDGVPDWLQDLYDEDGPGGGGGGDDIPDWLRDLYGDDGPGDGPGGDGGPEGAGGPEGGTDSDGDGTPDWMEELFGGGDGPGGGNEEYVPPPLDTNFESGGGNDDLFGDGPPGTVGSGPPLNTNFAAGGDGLGNPFGDGTGGGPGSGAPDGQGAPAPPPLNTDFGAGGDGLGNGFVPPPLLNGPGSGAGSDGGSRQRPPGQGTNFPGSTGLDLDPATGLPINPDTGEPFPVDPGTGLPYSPDTGLPINYDPDTGQALPIDPVTGEPVPPGQDGTRLETDPATGLPINPET
ncbi:hypothetical protein ADL05_22515, partial [Nocardiopsis sp. NRRL B-16309]